MADKQGGQPQSMLQGLQQILSVIGGLMAAPDADVQALTQLQHAIVGMIKKTTQQSMQMHQQQMQQAMGGGQQAGPGGGMGGGMRGLNPQMPAAAMMGGVGGGGGGPENAPNPDEMRRVMGAQGMSQ